MMLGGCAPGWFPANIVLSIWDRITGNGQEVASANSDDLLRTSGTRSEIDVITLPYINFIFFMFSFEFLAGNLEEDYPQATRPTGSATKYQI
jgi:hypothetical protein